MCYDAFTAALACAFSATSSSSASALVSFGVADVIGAGFDHAVHHTEKCLSAATLVRRNIHDSTTSDMVERFWTLVNGIMLLMFLFSAAVQFNDPDPLAWMSIYGAAAAVCGLEVRRRAPAWAPVAVALIALVWAGSVYSGVNEVPISSLFTEWEMRDLRIEEAREMYGLTIVGIWMIVIVSVRWARLARC